MFDMHTLTNTKENRYAKKNALPVPMLSQVFFWGPFWYHFLSVFLEWFRSSFWRALESQVVTKIMNKLKNDGSKRMLGFVVDFNQILYGSGDARTTENRCFVYTKHHFPTKAPIGFKVEF